MTSSDSGQLLFAWSGTPGTSFGAHVWNGGPAVLNQHIFKVEIDESSLDKGFFREAINQTLEELISKAHGGVGLRHVTKGVFEATSVSLPPLPEQKRIVAKLDRLSARTKAARDHLARVTTLATRAKQATLAAAFRGDLTADWRSTGERLGWSEEQIAELEARRKHYAKKRRGSRLASDSGLSIADLGELPSTWNAALLAEVSELQTGYSFKSAWFVDGSGPNLLRGANIAPGRLDWEDLKRLDPEKVEEYSEYILTAGDIVLAMDRPVISSGLKIAVVDEASAGALLVQRVARIVATDLSSRGYLWHLMNSRLFMDHAIQRATGGDLPHISANDILTTPVPLPTPEEQAEIVRRIEAAFARIDRLVEEATRAAHLLDRLDERLLAKAFRGELVSQDPSDEPAEALLTRIREKREMAKKPKRGRRRKTA